MASSPAPDEYAITTDVGKMDLLAVHEFLSNSYWAKGIPRETLERAIANSICFAVLKGTALVGFARVTTDRATFAYLADVFVLPEHRGRGLAKRLMDAVLAHADLQGLRRWVLVTRDAHRLYQQYGFKPLARAEGYMERWDQEVYLRGVR
jgi:ribosomal protein S18 acetylase RimI-like enzyme